MNDTRANRRGYERYLVKQATALDLARGCSLPTKELAQYFQ